MPDWGEALRIMGIGLGVVFAVMALIAVATGITGRAFVHFAEKQKAREKAEKEAAAREAAEAAPEPGAEAGASDGGSA